MASIAVSGTDGFTPYELELRDPASDHWVREPLRRLPGVKGEGTLVVPVSTPGPSAESTSSAWTARVVSLAGTRAPAAVVDEAAITFPRQPVPIPVVLSIEISASSTSLEASGWNRRR